MNYLGPIENNPTPQASTYGMAASALVMTISAVALSIILITNPYAAGSMTQLATFGTVGGVSLIMFVLSTVLRCRTKEHIYEAEEVDPETLTRPIPQPVTEQQSEIIPALINALFKTGPEFIHVSNNLPSTTQPIQEPIHTIFKQIYELMAKNLGKPELCLYELLSCYGPGKVGEDLALRRLIAAHNSGNAEKFTQTLREYEAIQRGNTLCESLTQLLNPNLSNAEILAQLPQIMKNHFCIVNEELEGIGSKLLDEIFKSLNPKDDAVEQSLTALIRNDGNDSTEKFKVFMREAFASAKPNIPHDVFTGLSEQLIEPMIAHQLAYSTKMHLPKITTAIHLLNTLSLNSSSMEELFPYIDQTSLLYESSDCLGETRKMQKELFAIQSACKALFVCDPNTDIVNIFGQLEEEKENPQVLALAQKYGKRIFVVPAAIPNHPFKNIITNIRDSSLASAASKVLSNTWTDLGKATIRDKVRAEINTAKNELNIPGTIKTVLSRILPPVDPLDQENFENLIINIINLMIEPIVFGIILDQNKPFEGVLTGSGHELADALEALTNQQEPLDLEQVRKEVSKLGTPFASLSTS